MEKMTTNVLIIGKSGVGKSALLNYLFGQRLEETGTGRPITQKGIFEHVYELDPTFEAHIYDTWGLEPDQSEEWLALINDEIKKHDSSNMADWFHTILYCINASSGRIEDFELKFLQRLMAANSNVVVVFTHSDVAGTEETVEAIKKLLMEDHRIKSCNIVRVCSEEKRLIGGLATKRFGREELLEKIRLGMWQRIIDFTPLHIRDQAYRLIDLSSDTCKAYARKKITLMNHRSNATYQKINEHCTAIFSSCTRDIQKLYLRETDEVIRFYKKWNAHMEGSDFREEDTTQISTAKTELDFTMTTMDVIKGFSKQILLNLIPLMSTFSGFIIAEQNKNAYIKQISATANELKEVVGADIYHIHQQLEEMWK